MKSCIGVCVAFSCYAEQHLLTFTKKKRPKKDAHLLAKKTDGETFEDLGREERDSTCSLEEYC